MSVSSTQRLRINLLGTLVVPANWTLRSDRDGNSVFAEQGKLIVSLRPCLRIEENGTTKDVTEEAFQRHGVSIEEIEFADFHTLDEES